MSFVLLIAGAMAVVPPATQPSEPRHAGRDDAASPGARRIAYDKAAPEIYRSVHATLADPPDWVRLDADVTYRRVRGRPLTLDVYRPRVSSDEIFPVIVYAHGGGWQLGSKRRARALFFDAVQRGYAVFSI
ncbi:MAG: hypothetical protein V3T70_07095, partial [Phycisphaerae bacterium]